MADDTVDILIVGGGLAGAVLMLALANLGYRTLLVEAKPFSDRVQTDFDARSLALSPASVQILQMLQIWPLLQEHATAIESIHVSEQRHFGSAYLGGDKKTPLGFVVEIQHINQALHQLLNPQRIMAPAQLTAYDAAFGIATINNGVSQSTVHSRLVVAADGADSVVRQLCGLPAQLKDYNQSAIVANIGLARSHRHRAFERFTSSGPLALLPMTDQRASLVWALPPPEAGRLMLMDEDLFLNHLQRAFGYRLGRLLNVGRRVSYPLRQVIMPQCAVGSVVFVGNAAHTLHPVAGQGFNLGLRDVAMLVQCIVNHGLGDSMLRIYQESRHVDQTAMACFTDGLVELFISKLPGATIARGAGLIVLDNVPVLKNLLVRYARGFAGHIPDLVCGIPLGTV